MKTNKRLEELLDNKDERISELEGELETIREAGEREEWRWSLPRKVKNKEKLPIPRLEIRCQQMSDNWHNWTWQYALIYKHFTGDLTAISFGETRVNSSGGRPPIRENNVDLPFREGVHVAHDSETLNLPAFAICDGQIWKVSMKNGVIHKEALSGSGVLALQASTDNDSNRNSVSLDAAISDTQEEA